MWKASGVGSREYVLALSIVGLLTSIPKKGRSPASVHPIDEGTMGKIGADFDAGSYAPVAERIRLFYEQFPDGRIETDLVSQNDREVIFKACVFRHHGDAHAAATGWAAERRDDGDINQVACVENTETSAVGRALANLGFTASFRRPSREEMAKAARARSRLQPVPNDHPYEYRLSMPTLRLPLGASGTEDGLTVNASLADATLDALRLLRVAEGAGLDGMRAESVRRKLRRGVSLTSIERLEAVLRAGLTETVKRSPL
jgi:hypothetical protein